MAVRIHFSVEDLARTYVAERPDPLWEVLLSLHVLQGRHGAATFTRWRQRTLSRLDGPARGLLALAPPRGYSPDFLTPDASARGLEEGLQSLAATSRARLRTDLGRFARAHQTPLWIRELTGRNLPRIADAVRDYYTAAIEPYETQLRSHVEADRSVRSQALQGGGVQRLLSTLNPELCWQSPVLELRTASADRELHLGGRGLRLIPSFFCWRSPIMLRDQELPPVLVYPIERSLGWDSGAGRVTEGVTQGRDRWISAQGRPRVMDRESWVASHGPVASSWAAVRPSGSGRSGSHGTTTT
ncbi:ArsR family transcriptional regulator [Streptomyces inhibens]|uniref:ArsR family transcriptional regulator n=1 Tax=Streptomyces inhibens TaxID=2293571 RepID=UPI001EE6D74D|nr:ArsR family transcriptional regulator [Streptomyces inhibens]UKY47715.1 ArsR family transcriptional regulator [Streptomyces inhibens]